MEIPNFPRSEFNINPESVIFKGFGLSIDLMQDPTIEIYFIVGFLSELAGPHLLQHFVNCFSPSEWWGAKNRVFMSSGEVGSFQKWAPLKPSYVKWKQKRNPVATADSFILQLTKNLSSAWIDQDPTLQIWNDTILITQKGIPNYGVFHITGTKKMPRRNFKRIPASTLLKWAERTVKTIAASEAASKGAIGWSVKAGEYVTWQEILNDMLMKHKGLGENQWLP